MSDRVAGSVLLLLCISVAAWGDEAPDKGKWKGIYADVAADFNIRLDNENVPLEFVTEPLLFWNNKASNRDTHGAFFTWTRHGRVQVISAVWSFNANDRRRMIHEFHSFASQGLTANHPRGPVPRWSPRVPGVELAPVPDAPRPGRSTQIRLAQMRRLAAGFGGFRTASDDV